MISELANHLWQSSLFAVAVGSLTLMCRKNHASVRYWLWFSASVKFFIPFTALMALGDRLEWASRAPQIATPAVSATVAQVSRPFVEGSAINVLSVQEAPRGFGWLALALLAIWVSGFIAMTVVRFRTWRRIRAAVRASSPWTIASLPMPAGVAVRSTPGVMEPGVVGLWHPVLLVPSGIEDDLTPRQLVAVLNHELCHIRRRDNVTAAVHMIAEAVFWFHPLVWWIGSRLVDERERACDEEVVRTLGEPQTYAEGIVSVCKRYVESPLACVSGVSGSNVKNRIRDIMTNRAVAKLGVAKKAVLAAVGTVAVIAPILAQSVPVSSAIESRFEVTSVKFNKSEALPFSLGVKGRTYTATNAPLRYLVAAAYGVPVGRVLGGPPWVGTASIDMRSVGGERFDILAKLPDGTTPRQAPAMLRVLLEERFSLAAHPEVRDASIYALVLNRSDGRFGPRLKKADVDCDAKPTEPADAVTGGAVPPPSLGERCASEIGGAILGRGQRLSTLARMLSFFTERPVIDRTGLTGGFDFDVQFAELATPTRGGAAADSEAAGMFTAVEEQLGLKLESTRGPLEFVVIHTVDHPKEN